MAASRFDRLRSFQEQRKLDGIILTSASSIKCFSGYHFNFETGPSPFHLLPALMMLFPGKQPALLLADNETGTVFDNIQVFSYSSYVYETPLHFTEDFLFAFSQMLEPALVLGIEKNAFPLIVQERLMRINPRIRTVDITEDLQRIRAVKDADEIEQIRAASLLADAGQEAVIRYAEEGMTELELFALVKGAVEQAAGARVPMMADLVSGATTASGGGHPGTKRLQKQDLVLADLTPCLNGYWSDSCNTVCIGTPDKQQQKDFQLISEALADGIQLIRPGIAANKIDQIMRWRLDFKHHGGHGVGTVYHEEPRITPYNEMILEPGMVIALEPALYRENYGIRLEHLVLVTTDGHEVLTKFRHRFL